MAAAKQNPKLRVRRQVRRVLSGCGFSEIITYSFIGSGACDKLLLSDGDERRSMVSILNPLTESQDVMRTSLIPGLFGAMMQNITQQNTTLRLYEIGKTFFRQLHAELPLEREMVSGLWTGYRQEKTWYARSEKVDFYDVKGAVEALTTALNMPKLRFDVPNGVRYPYYEAGAVAEVFAEGRPIGVVGKISPQVLKNFELKQDAFCFELDFESLVALAALRRSAQPISRFPSTTRDIALILEDKVPVQEILDLIESQEYDLIENIHIFDVYKGAPIPDHKKSVALRLTYCSLKRSLTDEEVNAVHQDLTERILDRFKAQLPSD
jgi:phenylalanyl-tRNA synthetase beta chain